MGCAHKCYSSCTLCSVYRTYPLNDPKLLNHRKSKNLAHSQMMAALHTSSGGSSSESLGKRTSESELALQNLAQLNVPNNGEICPHTLYDLLQFECLQFHTGCVQTAPSYVNMSLFSYCSDQLEEREASWIRGVWTGRQRVVPLVICFAAISLLAY